MGFSAPLKQNPNIGGAMWGMHPDGDAPEIVVNLNSLVFDNFEGYTDDIIPILRSTQSEGDIPKYFQKDADTSGDRRDGTAYISSANVLFGTRSLRIDVDTGQINGGNGAAGDAGSLFLSYYNQDQAGQYTQLRDVVPGWQNKTYNMMRYWIWTPSSTVVAATTASEAASGFPYTNNEGQPDGASNHDIGVYLRRPGSGNGTKETDNFKLYHYYNLDYVGNWICVEVDTYPDAQRGDDEADGDPGNWLYPMENTFGGNSYPDYTGDTQAENYWDMATYWYISDRYGVNNYPSTWDIAGIEFYTEDYFDIDFANIKSVAHTHRKDPGNEDTIWVQWGRNEEMSKTDGIYSVKYAYTSFYKNGGFAAHGTEAPTSKSLHAWNAVQGMNSGGHNKVHYQSDQLPLAGHDAIYIAMKLNSQATAFREVRIPLTQAGYPKLGGL
ncbi:hypothetical protein A9Q81_11665 [Gammaproteobacteria bacterium 42_54_T18]|nr:hypothetical protein A9Q81_11665 [Gammaproteobacteria bacterium 42_54_T18]